MGRTDSRGRTLFVLFVFVVTSVAIVARLAWWQVVRSEDLAAEARRQATVRTEQPSPRGTIYDRSGLVVLATTIERDRLVVAADKLTNPARRTLLEGLSRILELGDDARLALDERLRSGRAYVVLARDLEPETSKRIRDAIAAGELPRVTLEPEPIRTYPQAGGGPESTLAAHLIGFVNREGVGQYGVEQQYQSLLSGSPRVLLAQRDVNARSIPETAIVADPGVRGADLRLTIDAGLQLAVEQELLHTWVADRAISVSAVVIDPYSGEVYAHASYPSYDANDYRAIAADAPNRFVDPIVSQVYEPGSVFKMFTALAALEQGTVTTATRIRDEGTLPLDKGRTKIDNADRKSKGWMTFEDAIAWSRNVVAAKVALGLGDSTRDASAALHEVWSRVGFGAPTGIDLANASFGQGVAVTPIQLATSYAAMVNGGTLLRPHVVKGIGEEEVASAVGPPVIDPEVSETLIGMMNHVVSEVPFYRDRTLIPGYFVGGKTGTAQIWDTKIKNWKTNLFNYSFVGYVGREEGTPELVVAVRINEAQPTVAKVGQLEMPVMSFELFRRIATTAITTQGLLPDVPRRPHPHGTPGPVAADR
ncbi:MAG TPA: penicillin-binding protein 2 [Vitreimonas sp.]|nr:penicillin-binding protein 2 [Vitreimonas sp.]